MKIKKSVKNLIYLVILFVFIIVFIIYKINCLYKIPKVNNTIELRDISLIEYSKIVKSDKPDIKDVKKLFINIDIKDTKNCIIKEIKMPEINAIDNTDIMRSFYAGEMSVNNTPKEKYAQATKYIVFNYKGLTLEKLKKLYSGKIIKVTLITGYNKKIIYNYDIGKLLVKS